MRNDPYDKRKSWLIEISTPQLHGKSYCNQLPPKERSFVNKWGNTVLNLIKHHPNSDKKKKSVVKTKSIGKAYYEMNAKSTGNPK